MKKLIVFIFLAASVAFANAPVPPIIWNGTSALLLTPNLNMNNSVSIASSSLLPANMQMRYVSKSGTDSATCGAMTDPCLTVGQAETNITDATSSKRYGIKMGPGAFVELTSFVLKDWVSLIGSGQVLTSIRRSDNSAITWTPGNIDSRTQGINSLINYDLSFGAVTVQRNVTDIVYSVASFGSYRCTFGTFIYNGLGSFQDSQGLTFNDVISPVSTIFTGNVTLNCAGNALSSPGITRSNIFGSITYNGDSCVSTTVVATVSAASLPGTVTVPAGSGFVASPVSGIAAISRQGGGGKFTYTSYDNSTGIFSGAILTGGSIAPGTIITNAGNQALTLEGSPTGNVSLTATKNQLVYTTTGAGKGSVAAKTVTITGTLAFFSTDAISGNINTPTLAGGATTAQILYQANSINTGVKLQANGNWATPPTNLSDELQNLETAVFQMNGSVALPVTPGAITKSGVATSGILSSTDWNTFNNKQSTAFTPTTSANWDAAVPTTVQSAFDNIVAGLATPPKWLVGLGSVSATNAILVLKNGHIKSTQTTAPTATVNTNAGTGGTCTVSNATDIAGTINLTTTATAPSSGSQCAINFNTAYNTAPICTITEANDNSILFSVINGEYFTTTTTTLIINYANADAVGHANVWSYHCIETQ